MSSYHILNGDALKSNFPPNIEGEIIVLREILIEGPVQENNFFENRAAFIKEQYNVEIEEYVNKTQKELEKLQSIPEDSEVNLWFEDDVFCQCNLWYSIATLLQNKKKYSIHLVRPDSDSWHGFGVMDIPRLEIAYAKKNELLENQLDSFNQLWSLYAQGKIEIPQKVIDAITPLINRMEEILTAHVERMEPNNRPLESLKRILDNSEDKSFSSIFRIFNKEEGIYGYGDTSVKRIYDQLIN